MNYQVLINSLILVLVISSSCGNDTPVNTDETTVEVANFQAEKAAILSVLNEETKAAFTRNYDGWQEKWVHQAYVSKTYMNFADSSMTETLGWEEIDEFVRTYIEEHPTPAPLPELVAEIDVRLYGNGAWVNYEQYDPERGWKRETRLMEKEDGNWKIAGMQTIIYGEKTED